MPIRAARPSDSESWGRLRELLWPSHKVREHADEIARFFAGKLRQPLQVFLAFDQQDKAIGFIELSIREYAEGCLTDHVAYIEGWYIHPGARRQGVGAALVNAAEEWARAQGCSELASDTELDNAASAAAHRAIGFEEAGRIVCFKKKL